jgi:hypothetical protein
MARLIGEFENLRDRPQWNRAQFHPLIGRRPVRVRVRYGCVSLAVAILCRISTVAVLWHDAIATSLVRSWLIKAVLILVRDVVILKFVDRGNEVGNSNRVGCLFEDSGQSFVPADIRPQHQERAENP